MEDNPDPFKSNDSDAAEDNAEKVQNVDQEEEKANCLNNNAPHNAPQNLGKSPNPLVSQPSTASNQPLTNVVPPDKSPPSSPVSNQAKKNSSSDLSRGLMYNWQATKTTVRERFAFMFNNKILCDIYFVVGKNHSKQRVPAHKFVLSCGSAVFDAMFNGPLSTQADEVELPDVEPAAFLALLRYMYSDEVQIGPETVMATLYVAKKYAVPALEKACVEFLERNLGSENAFTLLTQARLFDEPKLAALCLETIDNTTGKAFAADGFVEIDLDTLCDVIKRDTLRISEVKLFQAVVRWAEAECSRQNRSPTPENLRAVIGKALKLIRFPLMKMEEFASYAAQSGILTDKEALQLFLYFTVNPKPNLGFLDTPRSCMTDNEITVSRFRCIDSRWGYSGTSDRVRLVVDRRIFIVGFGLYGNIDAVECHVPRAHHIFGHMFLGATHGPAEYDALLQLIHLSTGKVCGSNKTRFSCDGSNFTFRVMFKEPVEVQPHTSYIAAVTLKGPDSHYGTKGLQKVALDIPGEGNGKVTFEFYVAGINNGTSVEDGQIPEIIFHV